MSDPVLYRSIIDGWRVGVATHVANTSKVTVDDVETGLSETVMPSAIYVPKAPSLLTAERSFFTRDDDVSCLVPTPLEALPTLLHAVRCRYGEGKDSTLVGDNALIFHKGTERDDTHLSFGRRLVAAVRASPNVPQRATIIGDGSSFELFASLCEDMPNSFPHVALLPAAIAAIKPFCISSKGESLVIASAELFPSLSSARIGIKMVDYGVLDTLHDDTSFAIFGAIIHGCSHDEKNSCCFPTTGLDFKGHPATLNSSDVEACRVNFLRFRKALDALGFEPYSQNAILSRVSAVLQLLQIEFDDEGAILQLSAVKNTARALRVDYEQLKALLTSRRHTFVLASYLMRSTIVALVHRINDTLNASNSPLPDVAPISLHLMPSCEHLGAGPRRLLVETLHEDLTQCVFRSSEREILQWQKSGFAVSPALQHVFDAVDNYSLLKVLRGVGGLLSGLGGSGEEFQATLERVGRHKCCTSDPKASVITVKHSNDKEITYRRLHGGGYPTMADVAFSSLKDFILSGADADSQEAFVLTERQGPSRSNTVLSDLDDLRQVAASMADANVMHWWAYDVSPPKGGVFEGFFIEQSLIDHRIRPFTMLRQLLPKRFIPCDPVFIAKEFDALCDRALRSQTDITAKAESVLTSNAIHYLVTKQTLLVEARSIMALYKLLEAHVQRNVSLIQSAARTRLAGIKLARRVTMLEEAIGMVVKTIEDEDSRYRHQLSNQDLYRIEMLNLQEMEQGNRAAIRDACWVEWVALQTEEQAEVEEVIERQVAQRILEDERNFKSIVRQRERNVLNELAARVQERILLQGAHLDGIVATKQAHLQGTRRQLESTRRVHENRMSMLMSEEERKAEMQSRILQKNAVAKHVSTDRAYKSSALRDAMWARHERDRLARMELQRARDAITERMREKFVMEGIESVVAKRVATEVTERNKRVREAEEAMMRKEREERQREIREMERKQAAQLVREAKLQEKRMQARDAERAKQQYAQWTAQEKERQAVFRLQSEEQKQNKKLTSALLQAHSMLSNPQLFDVHGNIKTVRSHSRHQDPGFSLADGSTSYARLLPHNTVDAVVSFHQQRSPTPYNKSRRAFSPGSDYSL